MVLCAGPQWGEGVSWWLVVFKLDMKLAPGCCGSWAFVFPNQLWPDLHWACFGLIFIHGFLIFMNICHMSLQTIHTEKLLVTIIASLGVCNCMSIDHMSLQTVLTVKLFITFFAPCFFIILIFNSQLTQAGDLCRICVKVKFCFCNFFTLIMNIGNMCLQTVLTVKLFVTLLASMGVVGSMNVGHMSMHTVKLFINTSRKSGGVRTHTRTLYFPTQIPQIQADHELSLLWQLLASLGVDSSMNTTHISMQTVLTVKLFVTLFESIVVIGSMNIHLAGESRWIIFCQTPLGTCRPDQTLVGRSRSWLCFPPVTRITRRTRTST